MKLTVRNNADLVQHLQVTDVLPDPFSFKKSDRRSYMHTFVVATEIQDNFLRKDIFW